MATGLPNFNIAIPRKSGSTAHFQIMSGAAADSSHENGFLVPACGFLADSAAGYSSPFVAPILFSDESYAVSLLKDEPFSSCSTRYPYGSPSSSTKGYTDGSVSPASNVASQLSSLNNIPKYCESPLVPSPYAYPSSFFGDGPLSNWYTFVAVGFNEPLYNNPYGSSGYSIKLNFADAYGLEGLRCFAYASDSVEYKLLYDDLYVNDGTITFPDRVSFPVDLTGQRASICLIFVVPLSNLADYDSAQSTVLFKQFSLSVGDDGENELFQVGHNWLFGGYTGTVDFSSTSYDNPFGTSDVPISALPFRAYEMIYNSFYRDARNNPYVLGGEVQYNQFIPSLEGGKDSNIYPLRYRNWEYDFLTTSQPTPQFGNAPLVGITSTGTMTFQASEDGKEYNVQAQVGDDGTTVESVSYTENLPNSVARSLVDVVSSGISINDFRNVNSFQRFLETTMRRGLKAVDQLKAHFDVNASYNALDMPEFIGGISTVVDAQKVNNLNGDGSAPLGDYAGQLSCIGNQKHKVRCYCDEPGFIIGIVCVHPVPLYSQLLPKYFLKRSNLDYFFPEFGHIGLQPILQREVAPLQVAASKYDNQTDVFGYQRAWYDYLSSVDEVHGLFRTQLRDYVLNRQFYGVPKLSPDFTVINPNHLNDIFTVQDISDKILGKIVFNVKAVRPIPKYGIPKID